MLVSEQYAVTRTSDDDWFDAILDTDTRLFVDPFLIFKEPTGFWADAHAILITHFNTCFELIASCRGNPDSPAYKKALSLLTFREPKEFCLGYTAQGTRGSGSGKGGAATIAQAIDDAIGRGLRNITHFEELGILNEGIGPDRISDMVCNILKPRFIEYTRTVAARHEIPLVESGIYPLAFDAARKSWSSGRIGLPTNSFTEGPLLLVPARFLRDLPTLNADDWWDSHEADQVRHDLNYEVMGKVNKETIVAAARRREDFVREWMAAEEARAPEPYDFETDPKGVYGWHEPTREYARAVPYTFSPPQTDEEFHAIVAAVVEHFTKFVEENGGWRLLWDDHGNEKHENAVQLLFYGLARIYCRANGVEVDREVELGRGPVDFKFSNGFARRALLEVKKLHNGRFWDGLERQLPTYCNADSCSVGWLLAVQYRPDGISEARVTELPRRVSALQRELKLTLRYGLVDAQRKESASKL